MFDFHNHIRSVAHREGYHLVPISWEDSSRSNNGGVLSTMGPNITDVSIITLNNKPIYTLRHENYNEKLAIVDAKDIAVVVGNETASHEKRFESITLETYLKNFRKYAGYVYGNSLPDDMYNAAVDTAISVRFQTVFIPVEDAQFTTAVYSYGTPDNYNPQNLLLYGTSHGTSIHQSTVNKSKLFQHMTHIDGNISGHYLQASASEFAVGGPQKETKETFDKAVAKKQATAMYIGTPAMGTRFNTVMLVQIPLKMPEIKYRDISIFACGPPPISNKFWKDDDGECMCDCGESHSDGEPNCFDDSDMVRPTMRSIGKSTAARVSTGKQEYFDYKRPQLINPERHPSQHITVTATNYYIVEGGVPSVDDIQKAIADLNDLYLKSNVTIKLSSPVAATIGITSLNTQPEFIPNPSFYQTSPFNDVVNTQ